MVIERAVKWWVWPGLHRHWRASETRDSPIGLRTHGAPSRGCNGTVMLLRHVSPPLGLPGRKWCARQRLHLHCQPSQDCDSYSWSTRAKWPLGT